MSPLHSECFGSGPDLALVHGWGFGSRVWTTVHAALAQKFRIHLVTLPGYALPEHRMNRRSSHQHPEDAHAYYPPEQMSFADTAQALADALPPGCTVCGWSLGAQLAMRAAWHAPRRFSRLVLVGSTPRFTQTDGWPHAQPPELLDTFCASVAQDAGTTLQRFTALLNQGDARARANTRWLNESCAITDSATLTRGLHWLRDVDLRDAAASLTTPTLLIHGEHDPLMPLAAARWLNKAIPNSTLEVIAGAAHAPFLNDPEGFASLIAHAAALD